MEPIGEGGMGTVWRGVHRAQQLPVAVKFVLSKSAGSNDLMERFADEVRAVAGLDHPGIVSVFDYGRVPAELEAATHGQLIAFTVAGDGLITGGTLRSAPPSWEDARLHPRSSRRSVRRTLAASCTATSNRITSSLRVKTTSRRLTAGRFWARLS